ncbi:MAG: helicase-exonuclease AddAB subunit AddB [Firmicutes bacterium]|jgi:ATP-dependent helicase/nuclease subunit B|nr:helicase-exonuclease AddAB subunit AddB [Bacillota bacterium]
MIRYIIGRSASGKTYYMLNEIKKKLSLNKKVIMIVPEQFTLQAERDFIEKMNMEGMINLEILSFERLSHMVFQEVRGLDFPVLDEVGRMMALKKIFDDNKEELKVFKNSYNRLGFLREFSRLVSEFKRNRINEHDLEYQIGEASSSLLKGKISDIKSIYGKFNEFLENTYVDSDDKFEILIRSISAWDRVKGSTIYVDGFNGLTGQEFKILEEVAKVSENLNISGVFDHRDERDSELFSPVRKMLEGIRDIAERNNIKESKVFTDRQVENEEINHLEKNLFRYPFDEYERETESIKVNCVQSIEKEVELVAHSIDKLIHEEGYRYRDIAVVTNNMDTYENIIKRVFRLHDLHMFIDTKKSSLNSPAIKFLLSYLRSMLLNFKREDIFNFLKTGLTDMTFEEINLLENYSFEKGIRGNKWFDVFEDSRYPDIEIIEEARKKLHHMFEGMIPVKRNLSPREFTKLLYKKLIDIGFEDNVASWLRDVYEEGRYEYYNAHSQVWESIIDTLDQIVEILGDEKISLKEYVNVLEMGLQSIELGVIPSTLDEILVGSIDRSKSHDIKALFVLGMNDGVIPSNHQEAGILVDEEKSSMIENRLPIKSNIQNMVLDENLLIYQVLSKPKDLLVLSYSQGDIDGKTIRGSYILDRIAMIFPKLEVEFHRDIKLDTEDLYSKGDALNRFASISRDIVKNPEGKDELIPLFRWFLENGYGESVRDGLYHSNIVTSIDKKLLGQLYTNPLGVSISRLEKFVLCPFAHFVKYVLRPKDLKEYIVDYPDMGLLFHDALEHFGKEMYRRDITWDKLDENTKEEMVDSILNRLILTYNGGILDSSSRYKYLSKKIKRVSKRAIDTLFNQINNSEFTPIGHEVAFDDSNSSANIGPLILEDKESELLVQGRIDRIDSYENESGKYFRIIDYKSGAKEFSFDDLYYGLQMQLGLYSMAYQKNSENQGKLGGTFYFRIDDPIVEKDTIVEDDFQEIEKEIMGQLKMNGIFVDDMDVISAMDKNIVENKKSDIINAKLNKDASLSKNSSAYSREDLDILMEYIEIKALELGKRIMDGDISIKPCDKNGFKACEYCDYKNICQFDSNLPDNNYNVMAKMSKEQAMELMKKKTGKGGDDNGVD